MRSFLLLSCLSAVLCGGAYENPVVREDMPDPTVWQGGEGIYFAASTQQDILTSTNLVHWTKTGKKLLEASEYAWIKQTWPHIWAPDVVKIGDWYNLYICFHRGGKHTAIAAYRSKDPAGPFTDREILVRSEADGRHEVIDPETVVDPDTGRVWLFFGHGCVRRVELTADGRHRKEGAKIEHVAGLPLGGSAADAVNGGAALGTEGPYLHRRGGKWYLFVSEGNWNDHTYRVSVGRADTLDGTFVDKSGVPMTRGAATPILTSDKGDEFFGPGHNGEIFTVPSGRTFMFYHCHCADGTNEKRKYVPRPLFLQEILWGADGWPYFGNGGKPSAANR